jgi:SpoVK/Ycf46/Vps4 family AAA+-type ATPase
LHLALFVFAGSTPDSTGASFWPQRPIPLFNSYACPLVSHFPLGRFNTYSNKGIFLVGATNNPEQLDPAVTRPGRMDRIIEMPLPDLEGRLEIMTLYNKGWAFYGPIDLREVGR